MKRMTSPLKIMDEIEHIRSFRRHQTVCEICPNTCQSLRTAIEAERSSYQAKIDGQAEELARCRNMAAQLYQAAGAYDMPERVLDVLSDMASGGLLRHKEILPMDSPDLSEELAQKDARIARLEMTLKQIANPIAAFQEKADEAGSKLDGQMAVALANDPEYLKGIAKETLNETDRQSLAAVKAEALREYAEHKREQAIEAGQGARRDRCNRMASNAEAYADRIEQEAKEES